MTTTTREKPSTRKAVELAPARTVDDTLPLRGRLRSVGRGMSSLVPDIEVPRQLRKEASAVILLLTAALSVWVLWSGNDQGTIVQWWSSLLDRGFGLGAFVVPVLLILIAYRLLFVDEGRTLLGRHYLGGALFIIACVGLIEFGSVNRGSRAGGWLGNQVGGATGDLVGPVGGGLILFVAGAVGVFLMTGTDIRTLASDLRSLFPQRSVVIPDLPPDPIEELPKRPQRPVALIASAEALTIPKGPNAGAEQLPLELPVINRPKTEPKTALAAKEIIDLALVTPSGPVPLPEIGKLHLYDGVKLDEKELTAKARRIEETLASFKVEARVREINPGPAVTQYTLVPGTGTKVRRITELQNDLALALAAPSIRIEAPVPGQARVGLEIPNAKVATVGLRETLDSITFKEGEHKLPIPLGRDVNGNYVIGDLTKMPHLLIAGATGSGKSVCLTSIISTFLLSMQPDQLKMLMIDPKMVELTGYNGVPHLQCPVVTEMDKVVSALRLVLQEMERRYTLFSKLGVRNLDGYRMKFADEPGAEQMPYLLVIIDELADLMMTSPDDVEGVLCRLAQMGRASGIHLILATQRPSVDVLTGLIKANVPARIAFAVTSLTDSRVVLDLPGAERLLGRGDMLFLPPDAAKPQRIQGAFVEDKDVQYIVNHWHKVTPIPKYATEWMNLQSSSSAAMVEDGEDDPLMTQAKEIVRQQGTASASMLQRRLRIGYNRAARLIEQMEDDGMIGPADGSRSRPVFDDDY